MVCWFVGSVVESQKRRTTEEESNPRDCNPDDGVGNECASTESAPEHHGAQCIRVHIDGSGSDEDRGDCIRSQGPQLDIV